MTGGNHYGDVVNMNQGTGNTGIVKYQSPTVAPQLPADQREAIEKLVRLLEELRGQIPPGSAETVDGSLRAIASADSTPQERHGALMTVAGVAAVIGPLAQPVVDAVQAILRLLGAG
ncbi:hypothetical protein OG765_26240 [Streptomyces sp. NBC_00555]|uniref:hypothetical protein n=1 Tax=Streptomyces sp. NBC_00555 TaxID=2903662 RepID=UPI0022528A02|nr:hypothetical protein [Streptomyces sp. NBC_00555]MCX5014462.1 hypothetical protein [Streptomyces sp. NBC_00555]